MINRAKLSETFAKKGFKVTFFDNREEVVEYLAKTVVGKKVGFGGSMTIKELGLYDVLSKQNEVAWHWVQNDKKTRMAEIESEVYLLSANGVSETGEIVNIDGAGNRLAASLFGPGKVIYIVGKNKIEPSLEKAIYRARNIASVKNAMRMNLNTPCVKSGGKRCYDCNSPERICNGFVTITRPMNGQETEIIFVNDNLGY